MNALRRYENALTYWSDVRSHLPLLYEAARGTVLELGVRGGVSTAALLAGVETRGGHLWSVDIVADCGRIWCYGHPAWTFVHGDSCDVDRLRSAGLPGALDLVFIDTDHTYERTTRELATWGPSAKVLMLHDHDEDGVRSAVAEYVEAQGRRLVIYPESFGLAVVDMVNVSD